MRLTVESRRRAISSSLYSLSLVMRLPLPDFHLDKLPEAERPHAKALRGNLGGLGTYALRLKEAIALYDHCAKLMFPIGPMNPEEVARTFEFIMPWQLIACRDAGMSIWHFGQLIIACRRDCLPHIPTLRPYADDDALRLLERRFGGLFPNYKDIRKAIAHSADLARSEAAIKENALTGSHRKGGVGVQTKGRVVLGQGLTGDVYTVGHKRQLVEFRMTQETLDRLNQAQQFVVQAYADIIAAWQAAP